MTRWPMPLSPWTSAIAAASRSMRISGRTFTAPPLMRRMYCGRRKTPWPSDPFTSARAISSAMLFASAAGTSTASNARAMNASRSGTLTRSSVDADIVVPIPLFLVFFQLHQRAEEIRRVHERDALAVHVELGLALAEHAYVLGGDGLRGRVDAV